MPEFNMPCPHCNAAITVREDQNGQIITCMECGKTVHAVKPTESSDSSFFLCSCSECSKVFRVPQEKDGTEMPCPFCKKTVFVFPAALRPCPFCKEETPVEETVCSVCGKELPPFAADPLETPEVAERSEEEKAAAQAAVLGEKVSDSDFDGFESFEKPEEPEEPEVAELIKIKVQWRSPSFMYIVAGVLFLILACEIAGAAVVFFQGQQTKAELPRKFNEEIRKLEQNKARARQSVDDTRKKINEQIRLDEAAEAVRYNEALMAEAAKLAETKLPYPPIPEAPAPVENANGENQQPAPEGEAPQPAPEAPKKEPFLKENPFQFYLDALKKYDRADEDTRMKAVGMLCARMKQILDEIKEERRFERVSVVQEAIAPFADAGYEVSEVNEAAELVLEFEQEEKERIEQAKKDAERRAREQKEAAKRQKIEAQKEFRSNQELLQDLHSNLKAVEDKLTFVDVRPAIMQAKISEVFFTKTTDPNGKIVPLKQLLDILSNDFEIKSSKAEAEKLLNERYEAIEAEIRKQFPEDTIRKNAEKEAAEKYPEIARGQRIPVTYIEGNARYHYTGQLIRVDEKSVVIGSRTFTWDKLDDDSRKRLHPQERKDAIAAHISAAIAKCNREQDMYREKRRNEEVNKLMVNGVLLDGLEVYSVSSFCEKMYPVARELHEVRAEIRKVLSQMYKYYLKPGSKGEKAFVEGLNEEFGVNNRSNIGKAIAFYKEAAKYKCTDAQVRLGDIYSAPRDAELGVEPNRREAMRYYRMAQEKSSYAKTKFREMQEQNRKNKKSKK